MNRLPIAVAVLFAALPLFAQENDSPAAAAEMNPKTPQHELLKTLVGDWDVTFKSEAMPGVPGMEEATECRGTEHAELVCNGLFLKSVVDSVWQGKPMQMLWLAGYDPNAKHYTSLCVSSDMEGCGMSKMTGSYDEKSKTWTWQGPTPQGDMRSSFVCKNADTTVETCYMVGKDGKETKCMEITRKRGKAAKASDASAETPKDLSKEQSVLLRDVGEWDATMHMTMAEGQEPMVEKATESVRPICLGRWVWTDYKGQMMGMPFEGHALTGYDPAQKQYVSFWFDTMETVAMETKGTIAADGNSAHFTGTAVDGQGNPMGVDQRLSWSDGMRVLKMDFRAGDQTSHMQVDYKRRAKN